MSINQNLRQLRLDCGMTQEQVAGKIGLTRQALSSYESGRTRPDIEMLMRLCEVYGTDLDAILYGTSRTLKAVRRMKTCAAVLFILLTALTFVRSALLWGVNHTLAIPEGPMSPEKMAMFETRRRYIAVWEAMDGLLLAIALFGGLLLAALLITGKCVVPLRQKLLYTAALALGILLAAIPFAYTDPVYGPPNYLITPALVIFRLLFILVAVLLSGPILKWNDKRRSRG